MTRRHEGSNVVGSGQILAEVDAPLSKHERPFLSNVVARLVAYYAAFLGGSALLFRYVPAIPGYLTAERERHVRTVTGGIGIDAAPDIPGPLGGGIDALADPALLVPVLAAMLASFVFALPVSWVYQWTRTRRRTVVGFAQTLVVVPLAISIVTFLVKGSLPLAFSLAGIVAAVRFRSSLEEPGDAVYLFIVIGIGLAAGVQLLPVAVLGSMFFCIAQLISWRTNLLRDDRVLVGWHLEKVPPLSEAAEPIDVREVTLRVHTTDVGAAVGAIEPILERHAMAFRRTEEEGGQHGVTIVRFDMRLRKKVKPKAVRADIEAAAIPSVTQIEM